MRRRGWRPVLPIYAFVLVWLFYSMFFPLLRLSALLLGLGLAFGGAAAAGSLLARSIRALTQTAEKNAYAQRPVQPSVQAVPVQSVQPAAQQPEPEPEPEPEPVYPPEVSAIISDGRMALREMARLRSSISDPVIGEKISAIMEISDKIIRDAIDDPADIPQIRHFLDFYLPTTIKLLHAYDRMDSLGVEGENISGSKQRIGEMLDSTLEAYKKQLDSLFANQALDIDAEIRAMNSMLAQEGMGGALDWKAFKKEYDKNNQFGKGTTQNG